MKFAQKMHDGGNTLVNDKMIIFKKFSLWLQVLVVILAVFFSSSSSSAQEDYSVTLGQDKIFTTSNFTDTFTGPTPNHFDKGDPTIMEAISNGQIASTHIFAQGYQDGFAKSWNGVDFVVKASEDGITNQEAEISITLDYSLSVAFQVAPVTEEGGGGSADAIVYAILPGYQTTIDRVNFWDYPNSGATSGTRTIKTNAQLVAGQSYRVLAHTYSNIGTFGVGFADSQAYANVKEVKVSFIKVKIEGPPATVIYNPIDESPTIKLKALVDPVGGSFKWEIANGQDKIKLLREINRETILVQGIAPSENPLDVKIKVTYSIGSRIAEAYQSMTVRKPSSLSILEGYPTTSNKTNKNGEVVEYSTLYAFQIRDQFEKAINLKMNAWEERSLFSVYPPSYTFDDITPYKKFPTSSRGAFPDELFFSDRFPAIPSNILIKYQQYNYVEGWLVGPRCQTFYYNYGTSEEGICQ